MGFFLFYLVGWSVAAAAAAAAATATTTSGLTRDNGAREHNQWSSPSSNFLRGGGARSLKSKMLCSGIANA